jgi:hypothetical protein
VVDGCDAFAYVWGVEEDTVDCFLKGGWPAAVGVDGNGDKDIPGVYAKNVWSGKRAPPVATVVASSTMDKIPPFMQTQTTQMVTTTTTDMSHATAMLHCYNCGLPSEFGFLSAEKHDPFFLLLKLVCLAKNPMD